MIEDKEPPPPDAYDQLRFWKGQTSGSTNEFYVEAAAYKGKPVYFEVFSPMQLETTLALAPRASETPASLEIAWEIAVYIWFTLIACASVLAWRNFRSGRSDSKGAFRVAFFLFCSGMFIWLLLANHHTGSLEGGNLGIGLAMALYNAGAFWLWYVAL